MFFTYACASIQCLWHNYFFKQILFAFIPNPLLLSTFISAPHTIPLIHSVYNIMGLVSLSIYYNPLLLTCYHLVSHPFDRLSHSSCTSQLHFNYIHSQLYFFCVLCHTLPQSTTFLLIATPSANNNHCISHAAVKPFQNYPSIHLLHHTIHIYTLN